MMLKYGLLSLSAIAAYPDSSRTIRDVLQEVNSISKTWESGLNNKFTLDAKTTDFSDLFGTILDVPADLDLPTKPYLGSYKALPTDFDPRSNPAWSGCPSLLEVRDQSACGSCWAFGAASAWSDRMCIHSDGAFTASLSTEDLLSCCNTCGMGCNGGYVAQAWNYISKHGICTGGLYEGTGCKPYSLPPCEHHADGDRTDCSEWDFRTPSCSNTCVVGYSDNTYDNDKIQAGSVYKVGGARREEEIMQELYANGPVEASFTVYDDFMTYTGGVYYHTTGRSLGGHAVKLMGWGVQDGEKYWLLANSWNSDWGEEGFFRMRRGTNECGIEGGLYGGMP